MSEITVCGSQLVVKEYKGQRVVTFKDIDAVHSRPNGTSSLQQQQKSLYRGG